MEILNFIMKLTFQLLQWSLKLFFQAMGVLIQAISTWLRERPRDARAPPPRGHRQQQRDKGHWAAPGRRHRR